MHSATINALQAFPQLLEAHFAAVPGEYMRWAPSCWDGVPSEPMTAIEQICHVRDIEVDGYHVRFERALSEANPVLPAIDSMALAAERAYATANVSAVFTAIRAARTKTVALIYRMSEEDFDRPAVFDGYGPTTVRGLIHYLCSHDQQHLAGLQWLMGKIEAERMAAR
jgi:hypothetical protein